MTSATPLIMPPPQKDLSAASRQYVEQFGSLVVTLTYLKVTVLGLTVLCLALVGLNIRTYYALQYPRPWIIRIDEQGRPQAARYDTGAYEPQEREFRYFLSEFVRHHYGRMRATVRENYAKSLYFLDGRVADARMEADRKNKTLETFLAGGDDEVEVNVKNVSIQDLRKSPYRATVDFEKLYYKSGERTPARREQFIANFVFVVKEQVPNAMVPINPLGLTITYFREDQAFQTETP